MAGAIDELCERMAEVSDLDNVSQLLEWDQQTMMPVRGAGSRAEALATLQRVSHEKFVSAQTGALLDAAAVSLNGAAPDTDEAALVPSNIV